MDLILSHISKRLLVIGAPAGYGKTTLLADFVIHGGVPVCWVQLRDRGTDLGEMAALLRASLNRRYRRLRERPKDATLAGLAPEAMARAFAELIEQEVEEPFAIVIDEIQAVNGSRELLAFLDNLVEFLPAQVTTVVAGREPPEISLARLMANGSLAGIGPQDLALTRDELLQLIKGSIPAERLPSLADELLEDTGGWVTGVLLSRELVRVSGNPPQVQGRPMVYEYLASVVLSRVREDLRKFMRDSSTLRIMSAAACDEILQINESAKLLGKIAKQGLFLTESENAPRTYEYHPLFRKFLLSELESSDPTRLTQLRLRAARYQEESGLAGEAVNLYLEAGDSRRARRVAGKLAGEMARTGRVATLEQWAEGLRARNCSSIPVLRVLAISHIDRGGIDRAERLLAEIDAAMEESTPRDVRAAVENLRGLIAYRRGDYPEVLRATSKAESLLRHKASDYVHLGMSRRLRALAAADGRKALGAAEELASQAVRFLERAGEPSSLALGLVDLFGYQQLLGKTLEAWKTISRAHRILEAVGSPLSLAACTVNVGIMMHQRGRFEEALSKFEEAGKLAIRAGSRLLEAQITISRADLFCQLQMFHEAGELYERALDIGSTIGDLEVLGRGCLGTGVLHRRAGNADLAAGWLARAAEFGGPHRKFASAVFTEQAALTILEAPRMAIRELDRVVEGAYGAPNALDLTVAKTWLAYGWNLAGDPVRADAVLKEALEGARAFDTEQWVIGELHCTPHLRSFVLGSPAAARHVDRVSERLQMMDAVARQYKVTSPGDAEPWILEVRALGRGIVRYGGKSLKTLKPLHEDVLFYIVDRQRADRDRLAEEFWPEQSPGRQAANLHMAVYSLRRVLGKTAIVHDGRYYSIGEGLSVQYDVGKFERTASTALHLAPGDPRRYFALTEAINSYSGRFLEDGDQRWANSRRRGLDDLFLQLAELYSDEAMQRGNAGAALSTISRALEIDPLRDGLNSRYFELLGALGRRSELVSSYSRYVRLLAQELGLDPPPQVRALYSRLIS